MSRAAIAALAGLAIIACAASAGLGPCPKRCYTTDGRLPVPAMSGGEQVRERQTNKQ